MSRYRKSWSQALKEVFQKEIEIDELSMDTPGYGGSRHKKIEKDKYNKKRKGQGIEDEFGLDESAVLQLKMAFDDAGIKIKGVKSGKLVISKKDKKKVEGIISKQMKKPADAKRVLGSQIVFEDKASVLTNYPFDQGGAGEEEEESKLAEKGTAYPATVDTLRKIVKDKQHQTVMFDKGQALVDLFSASAMVQVYDALKPATKKKFEAMIKSKEGFMKSQAFAMKMAK